VKGSESKRAKKKKESFTKKFGTGDRKDKIIKKQQQQQQKTSKQRNIHTYVTKIVIGDVCYKWRFCCVAVFHAVDSIYLNKALFTN